MKIALGVTGGIAAYKAAEIVRLLQDGQWRSGTVYALASLIGGVVFVFAGIRIADRIS